VVSLPQPCPQCQAPIMNYSMECARCGYGRPAVYDSCGCVYCDLGLDPDVEIEGVKFHHAPRRGNILCERKSEPSPMAAFRYVAQ